MGKLMRMKYVRHEVKGVFLFPILAPGVSHYSVAQFLGSSGVISAGFVDLPIAIGEEGAKCFGESQSLGIGGLEDDSTVINKQMLFL